MIVNVNDYILNNLNKSLYEITDDGCIIINDQKAANIIFNYIMHYESFHVDIIFYYIVFEGLDIHIDEGIRYNLILGAVHFTNCNISCGSIYDSEFKYVVFENCTIHHVCLVDCYMHYCTIVKSKAKIEINDSNIDHFTIKDSYVYDSELRTSTTLKFEIENSIVCDSELVGNTVSDIFMYNSAFLEACLIKNTFINSISAIYSYFYNSNIYPTNKNFCDSVDTTTLKSYNTDFKPIIRSIPEGSFIAYKMVGYMPNKANHSTEAIKIIAVLEIPEDAKRIATLCDTCRSDKAKVLKFVDKDFNDIKGSEDIVAYPIYSSTELEYRVGETVYADSFDDNPLHTCSNGINFYLDKRYL